jgi:hypothetical protein
MRSVKARLVHQGLVTEFGRASVPDDEIPKLRLKWCQASGHFDAFDFSGAAWSEIQIRRPAGMVPPVYSAGRAGT